MWDCHECVCLWPVESNRRVRRMRENNNNNGHNQPYIFRPTCTYEIWRNCFDSVRVVWIVLSASNHFFFRHAQTGQRMLHAMHQIQIGQQFFLFRRPINNMERKRKHTSTDMAQIIHILWSVACFSYDNDNDNTLLSSWFLVHGCLLHSFLGCSARPLPLSQPRPIAWEFVWNKLNPINLSIVK